MSDLSQSIIIGTRGSPLALAQAESAKAALEKSAPGVSVSLKIFVTQGDKKLAWSLEKTGGKGLFTSELEEALIAGEIDVAVHSGKDLPTALAAGTNLAGCLPRADVRDVLVFRENLPAPAAPAKIATGSPRRRAQARRLFPSAEFCELRGNVKTRLQKIADGAAHATFLAAAGLDRLGITKFPGLKFRHLSLEEMIPAASQAAIALQTRSRDAAFFARACDAETTLAATIERAFLAALGEGCHTAFAVHFTGTKILIFREDIGRREIDFPVPATEEIPDAVSRALREIFN
ncbi:MAG: hydroxymethylbilane synthase [Opitutales bacterium]|nr:hydroxymethylbilane synthase [Opitutales bacterium]